MWLATIVIASCILNLQRVSSVKITRKTKRSVGMTGDKLGCDGGRVILQCPVSTSVYVEKAVYGRPLRNGICLQRGKKGDQQICKSPNVLSNIRSYCLSKQTCRVEVNEERLGFAITQQGKRCSNTNKYLKLKYRCVKDCVPPVLGSGVAFIKNSFAVGSDTTVTCRNGFIASSSGKPIHTITCQLSGSWSGGLISCKDIDECANEGDNKCHFHAKCINAVGSYACRCGDGYNGNGFACNPATVDRSWIAATKNESYNIVTDTNCGGRIYDEVGMLQSPNYPSLYPNNANCQWVISVSPSQVIEVEFIDFNLEGQKTNSDCSRDYLTIYNGPLKDPQEWLATECGNKIPGNVRSRTNQMRLEFKSDPEASYSGFRLSFRGINPNAVCENFIGPKYPGVKIIVGNTNLTVNAGDEVSLVCKPGYNALVESKKLKRICRNDKTWNDISNPCEPMRCNKPTLPSNPNLKLNGSLPNYYYKSKPLMYSCDQGYFLVASAGVKSLIFCNKNGKWSNEDDADFPYCKRISCKITPDLFPPPHSSWNLLDKNGQRLTLHKGSSVDYHSTLEYKCSKGYIGVGGSKRTCVSGDEDQWSGGPFICEEDNGIHGLTNHQIALITASISGVIIIMVGTALLYTCIKECKEKRKKKKNVLGYFRQTSRQNSHTNRKSLWLSPSQVSTFSFRRSSKKKKKKKSKTNDSEIRIPHYNYDVPVSKKLSQNRPYLLPTVVKPTAPAWPQLPHKIDVVPYSFMEQNEANFMPMYENSQTHSPQFVNRNNNQIHPSQSVTNN